MLNKIISKILKKISVFFKISKINIQQIYFNVTGSNHQCNICLKKTNKFNSDKWHLFCKCPFCASEIRHRLLNASLTYIEKFSYKNIVENKKVLHFAPEKLLSSKIKRYSKEYKTADFLTPGYTYDNIDYNINISDMSSIKDESFNCVIACDVLEHVPNHLNGIKEVFRVLTKGGYCIFTVPQKDNLKVTYEDATITSKEDREREFGQYDHLRIFGDDFTLMLENAGFAVTSVNESFFNKKMVKYHILFPPILSDKPLVTNFRKVFFGKKI